MSNIARNQCPHCTSPCNRVHRYFECVMCQQRYHRKCYDVWYRDTDPTTFACHRCAIEGARQVTMQLENALHKQTPEAVVAAAHQAADAAAAAAAVERAALASEAAEAATAAAAETEAAAARVRELLARPPSLHRDE